MSSLLAAPLLEARNNFPPSGIKSISSADSQFNDSCIHEASNHYAQAYKCAEYIYPDYIQVICDPSLILSGSQICTLRHNGTGEFVISNRTESLVTFVSDQLYGGLASSVFWVVEKSNTSTSGTAWRIIEMPRPYSKSRYCVTLAPDIPPPPLDGMGITLALSECVYDSENNHQDWILNFNSTLPEAVTSGNVEFNL